MLGGPVEELVRGEGRPLVEHQRLGGAEELEPAPLQRADDLASRLRLHQPHDVVARCSVDHVAQHGRSVAQLELEAVDVDHLVEVVRLHRGRLRGLVGASSFQAGTAEVLLGALDDLLASSRGLQGVDEHLGTRVAEVLVQLVHVANDVRAVLVLQKPVGVDLLRLGLVLLERKRGVVVVGVVDVAVDCVAGLARLRAEDGVCQRLSK